MAYRVPRLSVVGDGFCVPYPVELIVKKKHYGFFNMHFEVLDVNGNLFLQVDGSNCSLHQKRVTHHARPCSVSYSHISQEVIREISSLDRSSRESSEPKELLFSAEQLFSLQMKTRLEVFSPTYFDREVSIFRVVNCYSRQSYVVCRGENVIAEMNHSISWRSWKAAENFNVKVFPGVDFAFIVALIAIHGENILNWCQV